MHKNKSLKFFLSFLVILSIFSQPSAFAQEKTFKTHYTDIHFPDDKALCDFFWRISGSECDLTEGASLIKSRVDRIVERVQSILDMRPADFHVRINIHPEYKEGLIAKYSDKTGSITVYADRITDGVFAHELAHAVICNYFSEAPSEKIQEILAQYVDKHLWGDY